MARRVHRVKHAEPRRVRRGLGIWCRVHIGRRVRGGKDIGRLRHAGRNPNPELAGNWIGVVSCGVNTQTQLGSASDTNLGLTQTLARHNMLDGRKRGVSFEPGMLVSARVHASGTPSRQAAGERSPTVCVEGAVIRRSTTCTSPALAVFSMQRGLSTMTNTHSRQLEPLSRAQVLGGLPSFGGAHTRHVFRK